MVRTDACLSTIMSGTDLNLEGVEGAPNQALNLTRKNNAPQEPVYAYFCFPLDRYEDVKLSFALDMAGGIDTDCGP